MKGLKAIIFDMDGVLIDSEPAYLEIFRKFFADNRRPVDEEILLSTVGSSHKETWRLLGLMWGDDMTPVELEEYFKSTCDERIPFDKVVFPGMRETLVKLHAQGLKLYIASASTQENIHRMMEETHIGPYISGAISGETLRRSKPFPDVYLQSIELAGVKAEECIAVEDSPYGVEAAIRAGLRVVGVRSILNPTAWDRADYRIETVAQLPELLAQED